MWKCKIHSEFIEETLLRKFILHEVAIAYDDSLKIDEVVIVREDEKGYCYKKQSWSSILTYFETYAINAWINNYDYYYLQSALIGTIRTMIP